MRNGAKDWVASTGAILLATMGLVGCGGGSNDATVPPKERVLVIGIDGASDRVLGAMLRDGRLPNLAGIADAGVYGPLISSFPLLSPRIWTTVATGKGSKKHGIHGWTRPGKKRGTERLNYSYDRKVHALWNIVSQAGLSVGIVNWLTTYPPEIVRGVIVTSHTFPSEVNGKVFLGDLFADMKKAELEEVKRGDDRGPVVFPIDWTDRVLGEKHEAARLTDVENPFADNSALPLDVLHPTMATWYDRDQQLASIAREIQQSEDPDLMMILLQGIDRTCHIIWAGVEDRAVYGERVEWTDDEHLAARKAVEDYYRFTDDLIGELLRGVDSDDLVIVLSDHGFEPTDKLDKLDKLRTGVHFSDAGRDGVLFARGRGIAAAGGTQGMRILDVAPSILAWLGLPIAKDMDGRPAAFLDYEAQPKIATYDTTEIKRLMGKDSGSDEAIMEQLKLLGYIE